MANLTESNSVFIRPLTQADEAFLWEMLYQALYVPEGQPPLPRAIVRQPELSRYVEGWGRPGDLGLAALSQGQPVGAAWLRLLTGDQRGYGYIDDATPELSIALLPDYRGLGIGHLFITRLFELAHLTYPAISLSVSADNPAKHLYQRLGFEIVAQEGDSLKMLKRL